MRNPLARLVRRDPDKPTLRERAASLRASAARVIRRPKPIEAGPLQAATFDPLVLSEEVIGADGTVSFRDHSGTLRRAPVAHWIGFMALRMNHVAKQEASRLHEAGSNDLDADEAAKLWSQIRCEHRLDALHTIAFGWRKAHDAAKDCVIGHIEYTPASDRTRQPSRGTAATDAELIALGEVWRATRVACDEAWGRQDVLEDLIERPPVPAALMARPGDVGLGLVQFADRRADGSFWYFAAANAAAAAVQGLPHLGILRRPRIQDVQRAPRPEDGLPEDASGVVEQRPWPAAQARADEICDAFDQWRAEQEATEVAIGLKAIAEETTRLGKELLRLETEIAEATATTLAGVRVKVLVARGRLEEEADWSGLFSGLHRDVLALEDASAEVGAKPEIDPRTA